MSYDPRLAARPYGGPDEDDEDLGAPKGSVRAARERMQTARAQGQQPDRSRIVGLPQRPNQLVSQYSSQGGQPRPNPQQNLAPQDARSRGNTSSPQWPLANASEDTQDLRPEQYVRSPNRGPPPQRPPRPTSDELPIQPTSPGQYRASYQSDDVFSPTLSSRPLTTSSAASEASSLGSIPDFPVPQPPMPTIQQQPRRLPSLGPPPSSRRGPSSYYTQMSYVSPIAEENESRSDLIRSHHGSFASSNVFPTHKDNFYAAEADNRSDDEETITSDYEKDYDDRDFEKDFEKDGRDSRGSDHDDRSELVTPALVRQASLGRRTKPSLMTIRSVDSFGDKKVPAVKKKPIDDVGAAAMGIGGAVLAARDGLAGQRSPQGSSLSNGTGLLDPSSSSNESLASLKNIKVRGGTADSQKPFAFEGDNLASPTHPLQKATRPSLADRVGRRPPKLDIDAVRDAEARGSMTSLPELIRRATRLAANLDRGKTASRLGMDFWESGAPEKDMRRSGSLSDMLAAFPPPGEATPTGNRTPNPRRLSPFNVGNRKGGSGSSLGSGSNRRRRCCGMPMWTFVTLLIVLLFLIAAAVVIPIVLIVIPRMRENDTAPAQSTNGNNEMTTGTQAPTIPTNNPQAEQCEGIISCQNGGVAISQSDRTCNCVCINGFTGRTCSQQSEVGCTTTDIAGTASNATVGTGIPRLLESAQSNFSIPLDPPQLLSLFSNLGLSCTSENALITFNGLASRFVPVIIEESIEPSPSLPLLAPPQPDNGLHTVHRRQTIGDVESPNTNNQNNGNNNGGSSTESSDQISTEPIASNPLALDFARIGVLLVLQESRTMDTAANAQESLQRFLTSDRNGRRNGNTVDLGPFELDLVDFTIDFGNGTTIEARPARSNSR